MVKFPGMAANLQYARTHSVLSHCPQTQAETQPTPPSEDVNRPTVTGPPSGQCPSVDSCWVGEKPPALAYTLSVSSVAHMRNV